ncbi:hypothetical protein KCU67_g6121, partial [Aureobasidium melanogenum]
MVAQQHTFETQSSHSSFRDTVMGSKPELLQLEQGEKDGKFDEEKGAVTRAERPTLGDDGQRDAVATQPPAFDPRDNPDGGCDAWLVVLGAFCCMFCSFGWINCELLFLFPENYTSCIHHLPGYQQPYWSASSVERLADRPQASESFKNTMKHINYEETAQA